MSENKGFKNCPSITEFKVGMRVNRSRNDDRWFDVALAPYTDKNPASASATIICGHITDFKIDLTSIWVGRQYNPITPQLGDTVTVKMVSDELVAYRQCGMHVCRGRQWFLANYEPLPPCEPVEAKMTETWKPKANTKCWFGNNKDWCEFVPLYVGPLYTYGHAAHLPMEGVGEIVSNSRLHPPLPAEPPVQVGDVVAVMPLNLPPDYGRISGVYPESGRFTLNRGGSDVYYTFSQVVIRKLVPAQESPDAR